MRETYRWCDTNNCKRFQCQKMDKMNAMANIVAEELPRTFRIPETIDVEEENIATTSKFSAMSLSPEKVFKTKDISLYHKASLRHPKIHKNYYHKEAIFIRNIRETRNPCWFKRPSLSSIRKNTNRGRNICVTLRRKYIEDIFELVHFKTKKPNNIYSLYDIEEECDEDVKKFERDIQNYETFSNNMPFLTTPKIVELDEDGNEIVDNTITSSINSFNNLSLESKNYKTWNSCGLVQTPENSNNYENFIDFRENMLVCGLQSLHIPDGKNGSLGNEKNRFESSVNTITDELMKALNMSQ
uniref:Uncharacterized protein n=1 Tax=Strongyloides stercoralis TaxID=6248 RepID=A0A0K0EQQ8_STRER